MHSPLMLFIVLQVYNRMSNLHCYGGSGCYIVVMVYAITGVQYLSHGGCSATPSLFPLAIVALLILYSTRTENIMATPANATSVVDAQYVHLLSFTAHGKGKGSKG